MYKAKLKKDHRPVLFELLKLISEADGNVSYDEMEMIQGLRKQYKLTNYDYQNLNVFDIRTVLEDLEFDERANILTHAILLAMIDGELSTKEEQLIKSFFDLLDLEHASKVQKLIDEHGNLDYDVKRLLLNIEDDKQVEDDSIKMMHEFSRNHADDIDEDSLFRMNRGPIKKVWEQVLNLWNFVKDPKSDLAVKAIAVGALIYLISPLDVIPDMIPIAGLTDDVGVIAYAITHINRLIKKGKTE